MPHAIAMATHTARSISDHDHKSSCGAAVRRRHQRGSSWQLTTATMSTTSARQCTPSSMAARSSVGAATSNTVAAWNGWTAPTAHCRSSTLQAAESEPDRVWRRHLYHATRNDAAQSASTTRAIAA